MLGLLGLLVFIVTCRQISHKVEDLTSRCVFLNKKGTKSGNKFWNVK